MGAVALSLVWASSFALLFLPARLPAGETIPRCALCLLPWLFAASAPSERAVRGLPWSTILAATLLVLGPAAGLDARAPGARSIAWQVPAVGAALVLVAYVAAGRARASTGLAQAYVGVWAALIVGAPLLALLLRWSDRAGGWSFELARFSPLSFVSASARGELAWRSFVLPVAVLALAGLLSRREGDVA